MNVQPQTRVFHLVYPLCVLGVAALYVLFAVVPYFATGVYAYSPREVADQTVPSFPYGTAFEIGAIIAVLYVPFLSLFPGMLVLSSFSSNRHPYAPFERKVTGFALTAHVLVLAFIFLSPIGRTMSAWILD